jgi:peptide-methionine (S)-S-oxide reductase
VRNSIQKIGFGGGCHWCTEGVFQSLIGMHKVEQGWIAATGPNDTFSEAISVQFNPELISLRAIIEIHLHTHASTSNHSFREKYRSAVYVFSEEQKLASEKIITALQKDFDKSRKNNSFCQNYIHPKLNILLMKFADKVNHSKLETCQLN